MLDGPVVAGIVLAGGVVVVGGYFYIEHVRHGRAGRRTSHAPERIPLFGVESFGSGPASGAPHAPSRMPRPDLGGRRPQAPNVVQSVAPSDTSFMPPLHREPAAASASERGNGAHSHPQTVTSAKYADGQTLRFALPDAGTLQFLPGRLQVVVGPESGREIRFVRSPNSPDTDVSFGRSEGPPHRHVQLLVPTVSRRHAVMSLLDEHWSLQNLSATNPVTHNGRRLEPDEVVPLLVDGDRIEMGEVVFVFHSR